MVVEAEDVAVCGLPNVNEMVRRLMAWKKGVIV
jgi:hypothetical protein